MAVHKRTQQTHQLTMALVFLFVSTLHGQPSPLYSAVGIAGFGEKGDRSTSRLNQPPDEGPSLFLGRSSLANCPVDNQMIAMQVQHEPKDETVKVPLLRVENSPRFVDDRYYYPISRFRSKKAQKAILLDVGDYVIKPQDPSSSRSPSAVGGILRSSGR